MKTTTKILLLAALLLTFASIYKTLYLFSNYVVIQNAIKLGHINKGCTSIDFVCPEGCYYHLLFGFLTTNSFMLTTKADLYGNIRLFDNTNNLLDSSYTTEYCNWLDSKNLNSVIIKPRQSQLSNLDQYLTAGKKYCLEISSPIPEKDLSVWLHFEKKLKGKR